MEKRGLFRRGHMQGHRVACVLIAVAAAAPGAVRAEGAECHAPAQSMQRIELMFGRNVGGRLVVSEQAWARFLAHEVTPRFPDGFSVVDAAGQRTDKERGHVVREPSKIVIIVARGGAETARRIAAIGGAYKTQFHQQSVGVVTRPVCASF